LNELVMNLQEGVPLLKATEVADILNISRSLVYRLIHTGEIPSIRINQAVRVHQDDLYSYIENNRIEVNSYSSRS